MRHKPCMLTYDDCLQDEGEKTFMWFSACAVHHLQDIQRGEKGAMTIKKEQRIFCVDFFLLLSILKYFFSVLIIELILREILQT